MLPFRRGDAGLEFALFRRSVEDDETPEKAARREMAEEAGIVGPARLLPLDAVASVPASEFAAHDEWGPDVYVVTEHCFGVEMPSGVEIMLSAEHVEFRWVCYAEAADRLEWDSNRTALWELNERLLREPRWSPAT